MTKKNNQYRLYLNSNSPDIISVESLSLRIDPSVFGEPWYKKITLGTDIGWSGDNPTLSFRGTFDVGSLSFGPMLTFYNGKNGIQKSIGVSLGWKVFK